MLSRGKSKERSSARKVTPPSPTYMNSDQFAAYLANLRDTRQSRPAGARPLPPASSTPRRESDRFATGRPSIGGDSIATRSTAQRHVRSPSSDSKPHPSRPSMTGSTASRYSALSASTRDYYPDKSVAPLKPGEVVPSATYMERGQRWMEKEEAVSLRLAMDAMDLEDNDKNKDDTVASQQDDDESRLYNAALDEASELVWKHQHGIKPPVPGAPYAYRSHLRKNSYAHARTASAGHYGTEVAATGLARDSARSFSGSSSGSEGRVSADSGRGSMEQQGRTSTDSTRSKPYGSLRGPQRASSGTRRSSLKRNISGEVQKPFAGDQIWEEPECNAPDRDRKKKHTLTAAGPLKTKTGNPVGPAQTVSGGSSPACTAPPSVAAKLWSRREIHKNPPSQSRNPAYTTNNPFDRRRNREDVPNMNGIEIRGDDIREATSMRLRDRSAKLPTPSAVSDSPGRPIVSFDKNWTAPEEGTDSAPEVAKRVPPGLRQEHSAQNPSPAIGAVSIAPNVDATPAPAQPSNPPPIPSIKVEGDESPSIPTISGSNCTPSIPTIVFPDDDIKNEDNRATRSDNESNVPIIIMPGEDGQSRSSARPLPTPSRQANKSQPRDNLGTNRRSHWSPAPHVAGRVTATCHECGLPIQGRVVALGGSRERFHPQCFRCYLCGTGLEALEISPEPDAFRTARLDRIRRREAGEILDETPGQTMGEDGDERLRFYCHLDWHEQFAPRCKHCHTPILGEHIVALGEHWHYGHFFCAECGDPFEQGMTHIEKDGYAWCINCQTKRTERRAPKCSKCKKAVVGQYIKALGSEWHEECFRCATCHGGFDDGQIFPLTRDGDTVVLCTGCRASELKM